MKDRVLRLKLIYRKSWGIYAPLVIKNASTLHRVSAAHLCKRKLQHARRSLQLRSSRSRGVGGCFTVRSAP